MTLNPNNTHLTTCGLSGSEGALIAFRGSILGVGTDIAGSVRIPSPCCGLIRAQANHRPCFVWQAVLISIPSHQTSKVDIVCGSNGHIRRRSSAIHGVDIGTTPVEI